MPQVTLYLADGKQEVVYIEDEQEFHDLLSRKGKYASGWLQLELRGVYINLAAVVEVRPSLDL